MWKKLIEKLVEERSEDINGNEMIHNVTLNNYGRVCKFCTIHKVLSITMPMITLDSISVFFHFFQLRKIISVKYINLVASYVKMLCYSKIDVSEGIEIHKSNKSKERMICHY